MVELEMLSEPAISADGRMLAYLEEVTDWQRDKKVKQLVLRDLAGDTDGEGILPKPSPNDMAMGHWAQDLQSLLTILKREGDTKKQVYRYFPATQALDRLTSHPANVKGLAWSPDGRGFFFESDNVRQDAIDRSWDLRSFDDRDFEEIYYFDLATQIAKPVLSGEFVISSFSVTPNGKSLLVAIRDKVRGDDNDSDEVWLISADGANKAQLTRNNFREVRPKLSPDNSQFAFISTVNQDGQDYHEDNLFIQKTTEAAPTLLFPDMPIEVLDFSWDSNGDGLFVLGNIGLTSQLFYYQIASRTLIQITKGEHSITDWRYDPMSGRHVAKIDDATNPGDIYSIDVRNGALANLSRKFAGFADRYALPRQEAVRWTGRDGVTVEGLLVRPIGARPGERFPLVTITHGGPRSSVNFGSWNVSRYVPVLAGLGYGVFLPNHRGGTGYGDAFIRDMVGNYFNNADDDILAGIDALIDRGLADGDRLVAMGWSAGGHMTNWLIGQTTRFKAASSGAGVADWVSLYGESDTRRMRTFNFGGTPWEQEAPFEVFRNTSPLTWAWRIETPTLFFSGEDDERVPPTQGILMHRALLDHGVPTELYVAEGEPHNFGKPRNQLFKINRELQWYAEYLRLPAYHPVYPSMRGDAAEKGSGQQ